MIVEVALAFALGILFGIIAGLIPGIHPNLVATLFISFSTFLLTLAGPLPLVVFIVSLAVTNSFVNFIPSIFLGAPEDDTFLSVLPGHQMLMKGRGHEAVVLTLYGSLIALVIILIFTPIFIYILPLIFNLLRPFTAFLLLLLSFYLIFRDDKTIIAFIIFLLAGFLGYAALNLPVKQPLFPLLTGLFGSSALVLSLGQKVRIRKQKTTELKKIVLSRGEILKAAGGAVVSAPFCSIMPGLGSGHAATISSEFMQQSPRGFLVLLGAISTVVEGLSFVALYTISRARTGAAVAVQAIFGEIDFSGLTAILVTIIISGILSFFIALYLSKWLSRRISNIRYDKLSIAVIGVIVIAVLLLSNFLGFLVFASATALGVYSILSGTRRINLMGCLLVPVIIFYLSI